MFSSHPASCFCRTRKHNKGDAPLQGTYYRPAHYINNFKPHHNPIRSVSGMAFHRKGNKGSVNFCTLLWFRQRKDSYPEAFNFKTSILNCYVEFASNNGKDNEMIAVPYVCKKRNVGFPKHSPTQSQSSAFIHSVSSWLVLFPMGLLAFEHTESSRGERAKGLEEEFGVRFRRSAGQLADNERKWDSEVLELRFITNCHVPGTVLSTCLVFPFILIFPTLWGSSSLS